MAEKSRESRAEGQEPENGSAPTREDGRRPDDSASDAFGKTGSESGSGPSTLDSRLIQQIGEKEARKLRAREEKNQSIWFGLGMFGMVGWSVAVPTLIGIAIGCWLDAKFDSDISWCLTFLFVGLVVGAAIAWNWLKKEGHVE